MADEPTGNLDSRTSREVIEILGRLNCEDGITIILVTHDQSVARHARRLLVLRNGGIVEDTADLRGPFGRFTPRKSRRRSEARRLGGVPSVGKCRLSRRKERVFRGAKGDTSAE